MSDETDNSFARFCQQATDSQLEAILEKEWLAGRNEDYRTAQAEARRRGWLVINGGRYVRG